MKENEYSSSSGIPKERKQFYRRIFCALILYGMIMECPLNDFSQEFNLDRGSIQGLQHTASMFTGQLLSFCTALQWNGLYTALKPFSKRITFHVPDNLAPLLKLGPMLMPEFRANIFYRNHIKSLNDVANIDIKLATSILWDSIPFELSDPLNVRKNEEKTTTEKRRDNHIYMGIEKLAKQIIQRAQEIIKN